MNAPHWRELIDDNLTWGAYFELVDGTNQAERFGTSWAVDIIHNATRSANQQGLPALRITAVSDRFGDTQKNNTTDQPLTVPLTVPNPSGNPSTPRNLTLGVDNKFEHATHKAGLDIDVGLGTIMAGVKRYNAAADQS